MRADSKPITRILKESDKKFIIPVYQRNYSWSSKQCEVLFDDIMKIYNGENERHFVGSMVIKLVHKSTEEIIDGQQRLTTLFILCKSILEFIESNDTDNQRMHDRMNDILFDKYAKDEHKMRLKPIKKDAEAFKALLNNNFDIDDTSNIHINFKYFLERINEIEEFDAEKFYESLDCLDIVIMELENKDNAQIIFESINSTGLGLTEADLIRNFLLMGEEPENQERLYENYWIQLESLCTVESLSEFVRAYMGIKLGTKPKKTLVYDSFCRHTYDNKLTSEEQLKELVEYAKFFDVIYHPMTTSFNGIKFQNERKIRELFSELKDLNTFITTKFNLQLFYAYINDIITEEQFISTIELVISFVFRRKILSLATNILDRVFENLYRDIITYSEDFSYEDAVKISLIINKSLGDLFPTDEQFKQGIKTRNMYSFGSVKYLFDKFEKYNNNTIINMDNLSIEHIMPQKLSSEWKEMLGENSFEIHDKYLHTLGNLTITGNNSNLSNRFIERKSEMIKDYKHIKLNVDLENLENWTNIEMDKRAEKLSNVALNIWTMPNIDNLKEEFMKSRRIEYSFEEISNIPANIEKELIINEDTFSYKTTTDLYRVILKYLIVNNEEEFEKVIMSDKIKKRKAQSTGVEYYRFSKNSKDVSNVNQIKVDKYYIDTNINTNTKIEIIKTLINEFKLDIKIVLYK
ncbi:MAG: DUF262 domain-containing protein [Mycoplasmatales bacterium]